MPGHRVTVSGARTGVARRRRARRLDAPGVGGALARRRRARPRARPPFVRVLAGTTLRELQGALAASAPGWTLPLDPTEAGASLGGMVATNAAGSRAFRFGATRDWVVGLTVELASGARSNCSAVATGPRAAPSVSSTATRRAPRSWRRFPNPAPRTRSATASRPVATCSTCSSAARARSVWSPR